MIGSIHILPKIMEVCDCPAIDERKRNLEKNLLAALRDSFVQRKQYW